MEEEKSGGVHQHTRLGGRGSEREREREQAHGGERERKSAGTQGRESERALGSSFYMFFPSPWACPVQIGLSQECCLFFLQSSLRSSDLSLTFLCSIFMDFSLPCLLATAILDSFSLFYLPNISPSICHEVMGANAMNGCHN